MMDGSQKLWKVFGPSLDRKMNTRRPGAAGRLACRRRLLKIPGRAPIAGREEISLKLHLEYTAVRI